MKKIIALLLVLVMCLGLFAGCGEGSDNTQPTKTAAEALANAKEYLYTMYKDSEGTVTRKDYTVVGVVSTQDGTYTVEWTTDAPDYINVVVGDDKMVTIDINEEPTEEVVYVLTATLKDDAGNTESISFNHSIPAVVADGIAFVDAPVAGTAYKYALEQNNLGQTLYFTGEMSGYYLAMSENPFDAVDVYVEEVDGGLRMYFMNGDTKTYIDIIPREGAEGKINIVLTAEPAATYTWDAERKTLVTTVEGNEWYLGTYSTYNTISASNTSYIKDVAVIGESQFPAGFCTVSITPDQAAEPVVGTTYKFALQQNNLGQTLYFTGEMSGYYLATSINPTEGVDVTVETANGGYYICYEINGVKTYIDIIPRDGAEGKINIALADAPTAVYTWDAERKTFVTTVEGNEWYLGTYNTYNTISASNTSYIADVAVIGESQFPAGLYTIEGYDYVAPEVDEGGNEDEGNEDEGTTTGVSIGEYVSAPVDGTAYYWALAQVTVGKGLYVTGEVSDRYLVTTTDTSAAAKVYSETVDGGYKFYILSGADKLYIDVYNNAEGKISAQYAAESACVYTYDSTIKAWVTTIDGTDYYIGAYNSFETMSVSKTSYINAENTGVSQFPANLVAAE